MRGILLAGGTGSRLLPLTKCINKHLLPVGGKPMAQWSIEKFTEAGIRDVLIVSGQEQCGSIIQQFGDGAEFGCGITYRVQSKAGGIAQALGLARDFARGEPVCVILGDNIFDMSLTGVPQAFREGAMVFLKRVPDPQRYGVAELARPPAPGERRAQIVSIEEKPARPKSDYAVTGVYCYDADVFQIIDGVRPSARGELEITDVNNEYVRRGMMSAMVMGDDEFWSDAGTFQSYAYVNAHMARRQQR